jgi:hypothetical protein
LSQTSEDIDSSWNENFEFYSPFDFPNLIDFDVSHNQITKFPESFSLPFLNTLNFSFNPMEFDFSQLKQIRFLKVFEIGEIGVNLNWFPFQEIFISPKNIQKDDSIKKENVK